MYPACFSIKKYLLAFGLSFCFYAAGAQVKYADISFRIDSFANIGLPKSALKEVDKLDALARKNNNYPQQIRAVIYRLTFQSYLEENALTAIISRLKMDIVRARYPVKPVLQSLLGQMYWNYYQQNRYKFNQRSRLAKRDTDFTKWDLQTIVYETSHLYDLSLRDAEKEQNTPIGVLGGVLAGDSTTRYLRPTLYDLLVQRAFDFFLADEPSLPKPRLPFSLNDPHFFSDSRTFAALLVQTTDTASTEYKGIMYLQQATTFHVDHKDDEALADLDMQRLKFLYSRSNAAQKNLLYLSALKQIAEHFSAKPISSESLTLAGQFYQGLDSLTLAHEFFKAAVIAFPKSLGGKNADVLIKQIEEKELSATIEEVNMPAKPILALLSYKNMAAAKIKVYRLFQFPLNKYLDGFDTDHGNLGQSKYRLDFLQKLSPVQTKTIRWKNLRDYRKHSAEFKIDDLTPGNYVLLVTDTAGNEALTGLGNFRVSGLAYTARTNPDGATELRVMNRETGRPLNGVKINLHSRNYLYNNAAKKNELVDIDDKGLSDANGLFRSGKFPTGNGLSVTLVFRGDTLKDASKYVEGARDNSDNDPQDKTILFTDRQIYRPGQTIYFKALQLQTLEGKSKIMPGKNLEVGFLDVNNKQVSSLKLITNDFGTASGSFIIPQTMLNGSITLKTGDGEIEVRVEEYKRPTFQVEFQPVKESYKFNDSVTVKGIVSAFSGYGLSQAKVAYHIVRAPRLLFFNTRYINRTYNANYNNIENTEIKTDTIITDNQGKFSIKFKAAPGETFNVNYNFTINADVTDASGETHSSETSVVIGKNDIQINAYIPERLVAEDSTKIAASIQNLNGQLQKGKITVEVYALKNAEHVFKDRLWPKPDQFVLSETAFKKDFPFYAYRNEDQATTWEKRGKVIDSTIKVNGEQPGIINLGGLKNQAPGMYELVLSARNEKGDTTSATQYFSLVNKTVQPLKFENWITPLNSLVKPGGHANFLVGLNQKIIVLMERYNGPKLIVSDWIAIDGQQTIKIPITDTDKDVAIQFMMIYQNRLYSSYNRITVSDPDKALKLKFLSFRDILQPNEKERWKLQVSSPDNEKQAAELVADLYDASLDDIAPAADWRDALNRGERQAPDYFAWINEDFVTQANTLPVIYIQNNFNLLFRDYEHLNLFGYNYYGGYNSAYNDYLAEVEQNAENDKRFQALLKKGYEISGKVIAKDDGLPIPGAIVRIKGTGIRVITNISGSFKIKVPARGVLVFSYIGYAAKKVSTKKAANLTIALTPGHNQLGEAVVTGALGIKQKELGYAKADLAMKETYGLTGKVAGLSVYAFDKSNVGTKFVLRGNSAPGNPPKPIALRKNFNETAFFYPQLHTDEKGGMLIDFTIPEALTKWKFRGFAHAKDLLTGYIENTVITQKQLSISANTPRFLREGDTITIAARLANLTGGKFKGKVQMQLFNALNMQPVSLFVNKKDGGQTFEIAGNTNKAVSFRLVIPAGLDALDYRLTADAGEFSDGEENTLPVLPNRMLVTESMPMMVRAGQTRAFTFDKLVNQSSATLKNKTLTLEYTANPAWYAVQALPYMMEFPYECSEQVFSRYYANSLAANIISKMPAIKQVFDQWKSANGMELISNLEKNQELKETLIEETPWLRDAENETVQKKRIALLFDLNKVSDELKLNLEKLQNRQLPDGGFTWFGGDRADRYITQHIAEGIGELYHLGIGGNQPDIKPIADNALRFMDNQILNGEKERKKAKPAGLFYSDMDIHAWFTRSYFLNKPLSKDLKAALAAYLKWAGDEWKLRNVYEQGLIALTMQRYKKPGVTAQIERSLLETAQQSDDLGMYWVKNLQGYFWYQSPIETQSLLIELFTEAGDNAKAVDEMKIWLLRNKQTNDWKTTKATAAACYALLVKGNDILAESGRATVIMDGKPLDELRPEVKAGAGTGYVKTTWVDEQIKPALGKVEIKNYGKNISWGAMHWQYLENLDKITSSETNIKLERKYFIQKQTRSGPVLTAVDNNHQPKTGDLLKVIVYLKAGRDFEYVQLKDMRPAGTEPVEALSAYKYQDGLYYYQVTKDVATNFFISYLNKGSYVFEYQLRIAQPGNFSTGITNVQCMYAPEFNAHAQGERMVIKP